MRQIAFGLHSKSYGSGQMIYHCVKYLWCFRVHKRVPKRKPASSITIYDGLKIFRMPLIKVNLLTVVIAIADYDTIHRQTPY